MDEKCLINESYTDGRIDAGEMLMERGGCLPVRESERMEWKYDDRCGPVETGKHALYECS